MIRSAAIRAMFATAAGLYAAAAFAQIDLSGYWAYQLDQDVRVANANPADFAGIPLNADGRAAALSYSFESLEELGRQCELQMLPELQEFAGLRIWADDDPGSGNVIAWHIGTAADRPPFVIWVDGRTAPSPRALHTRSGFISAHWEGDTLVANATHIIDGLLTQNGVPSSNQATMRLFLTRYDDLLTLTTVLRDPVYLQAPYARAATYRLTARGSTNTPPWHCLPDETIAGLSDGAHTATELPGANPLQGYMLEHYGIPLDAAHGGAATMYPQFGRQLEREYRPPTAYCARRCCLATGLAAADMRGLKCNNN